MNDGCMIVNCGIGYGECIEIYDDGCCCVCGCFIGDSFIYF